MSKINSIKDISLEQHLVGGSPTCAGCGPEIGLKFALKVLGKDTIVINPAGCMTLLCNYPYTPLKVSWIHNAIENSAATIIIAAVVERTAVKYGNRAERYVHIEVGHVGQNIYLQAVSLGIGTVMIGAFKDEVLKKVLGLPNNEYPYAIMPLGKI